MNRRGIILLLSLLLLPVLPVFSAQSSPTYLVMYQHYSSKLQVGPLETLYQYTYSTYNTTSEEFTSSMNSYVFTVSVGGVKTYSGEITVKVSPFRITVTSQVPQLARVLLIEPKLIEEVVWAGFLNTSGTVSGLAYFNSSAELVLQFLNGTSFANVTLTIDHSTTTYTKAVTLALREVSLSQISEISSTTTANVGLPPRYRPLTINAFGMMVSVPYNTTVAYFNGTYLPAMVWVGFGLGNLMVPNFRFFGNYMVTSIEFFGVNGTPVAFIQNNFASTSSSHAFFGGKTDYASSSIKIVLYPSVEYVAPKFVAMIYFNGSPIVLGVSSSGVESTASVSFYHPVHHASLVYVSVNGQGSFFLVFSNSSYAEVSVVTPSLVKVTNVTINGKGYIAQEVVVNGSGYIMFNVTLLNNESFAVFKETSSGLVQLNPEDYFVYHGKVVVVDDPSSTYYIVYGYSPSTPSVSVPISSSNLTVVVAIVVIFLIALGVGVYLARRK